MKELVLELKVQEIPAGLQQDGEASLKRLFVEFLRNNGVENVEIETSSLSSRLTLIATNLPEATANITEETRGPKTSAPEKALEGFMKANNIQDASEMEKRNLEKGEFYFVTRRVLGRDLEELLAEELPKIINNIPWKNSMSWGTKNITFVRPIDSICAILDGKVINFEIDNIKSSDITSGHFFMHNDKFKVTSAIQYKTELGRRKVMLSRDERKKSIVGGIEKIISELGVELVPDNKLLDEVSGLIEYPYAVLSSFDEHFLELPKEVLINTMADHQRYFALQNSEGKLVNKFIGISNMPDEKGFIAEGYTKVITARFDDAKFYWEGDSKVTLESQGEKLTRVVFQKDLGTVAEKMERVSALMPTLTNYIPSLDATKSKRAAELAKCDLNSGVVAEFPELQGVIGAYLAKNDDEDAEVVEAISNQYEYQEFTNMSQTSLALILADRLDTLVGFFGINQPPTGSKDPYALRRAALSIIKLLRQHKLRLPLNEVINSHIKRSYQQFANTSFNLSNTLVEFFMDRLKVALREEGISHDIVDAVFAKGLDDIVDVANRSKALQSFMNGEEGTALYSAFKRASNILAKENGISTSVEQSLLKEAAESNLFSSFGAVETSVTTMLKAEDYSSAMKELSTLRNPVDTFFNDIMVMAEDLDLRTNRLALLGEMTTLFNEVADFSKISG